MEWSADQVSAEQPEEPESSTQLSTEAGEFDPAVDAYAVAELERRRLRTEAMIAKARGLS